MRWIVGLLLVMGLALGADEAQRVREAAAGWTEGAVRQDREALMRFLAEDLQYAHAGGQRQTRAEYIAAVTKGPARYEAFSFSDVAVRVNGNVAWLTGFVDVKLVGQESFRVRTL